MDGNYSLHKKKKEGDTDDVALAEGESFFVPNKLIQPHLDSAKNQPKRRGRAGGKNKGNSKGKAKEGGEQEDGDEDKDKDKDSPVRKSI